MLAVDPVKAHTVLRSTEAERRHQQLLLRVELADSVRHEVERKVAAVHAQQQRQLTELAAATAARQQESERSWQEREAQLERERAKLAHERDLATQRSVEVEAEASGSAAQSTDERQSLLRMHATVLEQSTEHNQSLRAEIVRLGASHAAMERELRAAEMDTALQRIEYAILTRHELTRALPFPPLPVPLSSASAPRGAALARRTHRVRPMARRTTSRTCWQPGRPRRRRHPNNLCRPRPCSSRAQVGGVDGRDGRRGA
jgi:hypothetical protein